MIIRVAICSRCVPDDSPRTKARIRQLRRRIENTGLGLFASTSDRDAFLESVPDGLESQAWEIAIDRQLIRVLDLRSVHAHPDLDALRETYGDVADVIVCDSAQGPHFGLDPDFPVDQGRPALAPLDAVELIELFESTPEVEVPAGTPREDVWRDRFRIPALHVRHLTVVDRYALVNERQRSESSGFRWFLRRLAEDRLAPEPLKLEIVVAATDRRATPAEQLADAIDAFGLRDPDPAIFRYLAVYLADKEFAVKNLHDRFVRFDARVLNCTTGLNLLGDERLYQRASISLGTWSDSDERMELVEEHCVGAEWRSRSRMWRWKPEGARVRFQVQEAS